MKTNVTTEVDQLGGLTRFLPASLVFLLVHVLFVGCAIFLAAME